MGNYESVKKWRRKPKNQEYNAKFMREKRAYYRIAYKKGEVKYEDIPVAYRTFLATPS